MKNRLISLTATSFATVLLIATPLIGFAETKEKDNDTNTKKENGISIKHENLVNARVRIEDAFSKWKNGIGNAFGHLIAPGWLKHHASSTPPVATTTPPMVTAFIATSPRPHEARVSLTTNTRTSIVLWYGTTSPVNTSVTPQVTRKGFTLKHDIDLNRLASSTTYYVVARSTDTSGNSATSTGSFTTTLEKPPKVTGKPVISNAVAVIGSTSAHLTWNTKTAADSEVYYSTTSPVVIGSASTIAVIDASLVTSHSVTVNLATSTTYYMIIRSKDAGNNLQSTGQFTFTTGM